MIGVISKTICERFDIFKIVIWFSTYIVEYKTEVSYDLLRNCYSYDMHF